MKILMFEDQLIEPILQGCKVQTVRPPRKRPVAVGDALSLRVWMGHPYLSPHRALLETHCTSVVDVMLDDGGLVLDYTKKFGSRFGSRQSVEATERFAVRDGFGQFAEMREFFRKMHGLNNWPFKGVAIGWD
jgi:hypothetical protein